MPSRAQSRTKPPRLPSLGRDGHTMEYDSKFVLTRGHQGILEILGHAHMQDTCVDSIFASWCIGSCQGSPKDSRQNGPATAPKHRWLLRKSRTRSRSLARRRSCKRRSISMDAGLAPTCSRPKSDPERRERRERERVAILAQAASGSRPSAQTEEGLQT